MIINQISIVFLFFQAQLLLLSPKVFASLPDDQYWIEKPLSLEEESFFDFAKLYVDGQLNKFKVLQHESVFRSLREGISVPDAALCDISLDHLKLFSPEKKPLSVFSQLREETVAPQEANVDVEDESTFLGDLSENEIDEIIIEKGVEINDVAQENVDSHEADVQSLITASSDSIIETLPNPSPQQYKEYINPPRTHQYTFTCPRPVQYHPAPPIIFQYQVPVVYAPVIVPVVSVPVVMPNKWIVYRGTPRNLYQFITSKSCLLYLWSVIYNESRTSAVNSFVLLPSTVPSSSLASQYSVSFSSIGISVNSHLRSPGLEALSILLDRPDIYFHILAITSVCYTNLRCNMEIVFRNGSDSIRNYVSETILYTLGDVSINYIRTG